MSLDDEPRWPKDRPNRPIRRVTPDSTSLAERGAIGADVSFGFAPSKGAANHPKTQWPPRYRRWRRFGLGHSANRGTHRETQPPPTPPQRQSPVDRARGRIVAVRRVLSPESVLAHRQSASRIRKTRTMPSAGHLRPSAHPESGNPHSNMACCSGRGKRGRCRQRPVLDREFRPPTPMSASCPPTAAPALSGAWPRDLAPIPPRASSRRQVGVRRRRARPARAVRTPTDFHRAPPGPETPTSFSRAHARTRARPGRRVPTTPLAMITVMGPGRDLTSRSSSAPS